MVRIYGIEIKQRRPRVNLKPYPLLRERLFGTQMTLLPVLYHPPAPSNRARCSSEQAFCDAFNSPLFLFFRTNKNNTYFRTKFAAPIVYNSVGWSGNQPVILI